MCWDQIQSKLRYMLAIFEYFIKCLLNAEMKVRESNLFCFCRLDLKLFFTDDPTSVNNLFYIFLQEQFCVFIIYVL